MGRWRPPAPSASPYITPAGDLVLNKKLEGLHRRIRYLQKRLVAKMP